MRVDFHVHLEEGPYSSQWLHQLTETLGSLLGDEKDGGRREWAYEMVGQLAKRLRQGPYSREWLDLYRAYAKQTGIEAVCIVEHMYRFAELRELYEQHVHLSEDRLGQIQRRWLDRVMNDSLHAYTAFLQGEKQRWHDDGVELRIGIELDYFPGAESELAHVIEAYPWDVCMGSVHFIQGWGFHHPETKDKFGRMDLPVLYGRYFDLVQQAVESKLFDVIAHIDGIKLFGYRPDETALLAYYQRVARALRRWDVATEISTGYLSSPMREISPSLRMLEILAHHEVPITTSSNAFFPDQVGQHLDEAHAQLKRAGITAISSFEKRKRSLLPLD
ncbi:histidinol-phosphatase [Brevibacillus reuszeri]|uniref:Histidinol-phosphatase n=1 Tax=Brevibacillus reuszeri TaxID=54915 RepID=A0A0K9YJ43_9BACL|nr:histidinol phosphate phosphatase domain-containing protein [Brevibacillus reuszeri]KNB68722.1 histidinol phosphatase [Brevibacillus reuszeri]MED1859016.1 histidinol phosphate phosphatase domain-containing protein [Brevibacillus reuszeri]GED69235.1 histidinol-phosphatase [Brevibacillus reuszeri]